MVRDWRRREIYKDIKNSKRIIKNENIRLHVSIEEVNI